MQPADVQATFCATLVDQWVRLGLRHAVVAPGSRSTPMALALAARDDLAVHVVHDERSAAFIALGIGLATGTPAALLCTSGTAAAHFHAAVVEADLSGVPMLVLTADRPPELQGIGAPQTIDQIELYGGVVRRSPTQGCRRSRRRRWVARPGAPIGGSVPWAPTPARCTSTCRSASRWWVLRASCRHRSIPDAGLRRDGWFMMRPGPGRAGGDDRSAARHHRRRRPASTTRQRCSVSRPPCSGRCSPIRVRVAGTYRRRCRASTRCSATPGSQQLTRQRWCCTWARRRHRRCSVSGCRPAPRCTCRCTRNSASSTRWASSPSASTASPPRCATSSRRWSAQQPTGNGRRGGSRPNVRHSWPSMMPCRQSRCSAKQVLRECSAGWPCAWWCRRRCPCATSSGSVGRVCARWCTPIAGQTASTGSSPPASVSLPARAKPRWCTSATWRSVTTSRRSRRWRRGVCRSPSWSPTTTVAASSRSSRRRRH
jgi:hypothetical protein